MKTIIERQVPPPGEYRDAMVDDAIELLGDLAIDLMPVWLSEQPKMAEIIAEIKEAKRTPGAEKSSSKNVVQDKPNQHDLDNAQSELDGLLWAASLHEAGEGPEIPEDVLDEAGLAVELIKEEMI